MKLPNVIRSAEITKALLLALLLLCFGIVAAAKPTASTVRPEVTSKATFAQCILGATPLGPHISPGAGETFNLQITILGSPGCGWVASSDAQWIDTHPASGATNQTVFVEVYPNLGATRAATVKVKGYYNLQPTGTEFSIIVTQPMLTCSYSFDKTSSNFGNGNGFGYLQVTASASSCPRNATSNASWLTLTSGTEANGSGPVGFSVAPNPGPVRTGKISLGNATFTVTQGSGCNDEISPFSKSFDATGGTGAINVTTSTPSCPRVATAVANWITITSSNSLIGSGPITYKVDPNPGPARTGVIKVGGWEFAVMQGGGCTYTLSPTIFNFQPGNGSSSILVTASSASCQWTPSSNASWVKIINPGQRTGTSPINFTTDPNPSSARTAKITVGDKSATINQAANNNCTFTISPGTAQVGVGGGDLSVNVTASNSCAWQASSGFSFVSIVSGAVGAGNGTVKLKVQANPGAPRTATIAIAGKPFVVSQDGTNGAVAMWITDLSPGFASKGGKAFQVTVKGANFVNGCNVRWNGEDRPTQFVNSSTLLVTIPATDITDEGANDVTVAKPNNAEETNPEPFLVYGAVANVSSASFKGDVLAPASLVSAFGIDLATELKIANSQTLPTELAGSTVTIVDAVGKQHSAQLFFVSPGQINYLMPEAIVPGKATVMIESGSGHTSVGTVDIAQVAPALFSANSNGQGVATALALRVKANGQQIYEPVAQYDSVAGTFKAKPIDLSVQGEQVYLIFYGTGLRYRNSLSSVSVVMGGVFGDPLYAGMTPGFLGLDQINVLAPKSLVGHGEVDVVLTVDGKKANTVRLMFK